MPAEVFDPKGLIGFGSNAATAALTNLLSEDLHTLYMSASPSLALYTKNGYCWWSPDIRDVIWAQFGNFSTTAAGMRYRAAEYLNNSYFVLGFESQDQGANIGGKFAADVYRYAVRIRQSGKLPGF